MASSGRQEGLRRGSGRLRASLWLLPWSLPQARSGHGDGEAGSSSRGVSPDARPGWGRAVVMASPAPGR